MLEGFKHRIITGLGGIPNTPTGLRTAADQVLAEARLIAEAAATQTRAGLEREDKGWQRLSGGAPAGLGGFTLDSQRNHAMRLWHYSPLARGIIEISLGFQLADGVTFTAADEFDQAIVDQFWRHPVNNFDTNLTKRVRSIMLTGEACWPVFTGEINGLQRIGDLHPSLIKEVIPDPDNSNQAIGVVKRQTMHHPERIYRVINIGGDEMFSPTALAMRAGWNDGECHFFAINNVAGLRGTGDLLPAIDWIEAYEHALFGELERWALLRSFIWDVTVQGADQAELDRRAESFKQPRPGDVRMHNEAETWTALAPDLGSYEVSNITRLLRNHILAALALPEHWVGGGGDVNRATAGEMDEPTLKVLTARRNLIHEWILTVQRYNMASQLGAIGHVGIDERINAVNVSMPELSSPDVAKHSTALVQTAAAAMNLKTSGMITHEYALRLITVMAEKLGVKVDAEQLLNDARAEAEATKAAQMADDDFGGAGYGADPEPVDAD
jgi:hypothetical protein